MQEDDFVGPAMRSRASTAMSSRADSSHGAESVQIDVSDLTSQPVSFVPKLQPAPPAAPRDATASSPPPRFQRTLVDVVPPPPPALTHPSVVWSRQRVSLAEPSHDDAMTAQPFERLAHVLREEALRRCHIETEAANGYDALAARRVAVQQKGHTDVIDYVCRDENFERQAIAGWHLRDLAALAAAHAKTIDIAALALREAGERRRIERFASSATLLQLPSLQRAMRRGIEASEEASRETLMQQCSRDAPFIELRSSESFLRSFYERHESEEFAFAVILRRYVGAKRILEQDERHWRLQLTEAEVRERSSMMRELAAAFPIAMAMSQIRRVHEASARITRFIAMVAARNVARRYVAERQRRRVADAFESMVLQLGL